MFDSNEVVLVASAKRTLTYDPRAFADPQSFRLKFFEEMAEEGRVCTERGPGDPAVGITSEVCSPALEEITVDNACGCASARYWCRHGHSWIELQCRQHSVKDVSSEMDEWDARR